MNVTILQKAARLFLLLLFTGAVSRLSAAEVQRATEIINESPGCVALVGCGIIGNSAHAVDNSSATAATISPALALSSAALRVGFLSTVPVGARVSMLVSMSGGGLNLGLLGQTSIRTFNSMGGSALQDYSLNSLLTLTVLTSNIMQVEFPVTTAFKQLEVRTGGALNVLLGSYTLSLHEVTATFTPLPVELVAFTGKAAASTVGLNWETASEKNSAYFQVERSLGAESAFQAIGKVAAAGTSTRPTNYRFVDAQPVHGTLAYYRLKQVDADGAVAYSPLVAVKAEEGVAVTAYPNPATDAITVTGPVGTHFILANRLGQTVQKNEIPVGQLRELSLQGLPEGVYFLRDLTTGASVKVVKAMGY